MQDYAKAIQQNRFHDFSVQFQARAKEVRIRQTKHKFGFGSNIFGLLAPEGDKLNTYRSAILESWNVGTLPFYWGRYENEEGKSDPGGKVMEAARWAKSKGIEPKGHPLCWHTVCADWLMQYDDETILAKQLERITRDVSLYKGLIDTWDVVNEAVIMPVFNKYDNAVSRIAKRYGTVELILKCFKAARQANPKAKLLINDFDLSEDYAQLIAKLLDRGCEIDAIGLQTHMHEGYRGQANVAVYLERFERFKLPLHFTELTILSGTIAPKVDDLNDLHIDSWPSTTEGEERQRQEAAEFYSQIYAHPLTEGLVWWDMVDGNWLGAPAGLLRADLSRKPAFNKLHELIKGDWWFPERTIALSEGKPILLRAPEGTYEAVIEGLPHAFTLDKGTPKVVV